VEELSRNTEALVWSGLAAGLSIGFFACKRSKHQRVQRRRPHYRKGNETMKSSLTIMLSTLVFLFGFTAPAFAAEVENYSSTIETFRSSPVVADFFRNSYGYAVFPTIGKAGYVVGGSYGQGQVYRNGEVTGKTSVIEGSIGFQLGAKAFSEIIFFKDKQAYNEFISGEFEFDAQAQAVAVTAGAQAKAGTAGASAGASAGPKTGVQAKAVYVDGMVTFVHAKGGLMYEFSVGGQKFTFTPL
jgi:lipid-binding SYLF domain-containing protein